MHVTLTNKAMILLPRELRLKFWPVNVQVSLFFKSHRIIRPSWGKGGGPCVGNKRRELSDDEAASETAQQDTFISTAEGPSPLA